MTKKRRIYQISIALLLCLFIVIQAVVSRSRQRLNSEH